MEQLNIGLLFLHASAGAAALILGGIAIGARKGGAAHTRTGNGYFWAMLVVAFTALWLSAYKSNWFLLAVGLFSLYGTIGGKLILQKTATARLQQQWRWLAFTGLAVGGIMLGVSCWLYYRGSGMAVVLLVFGVIQSIQAYQDWRYSQDFEPKQRILQHISKMGATYIATVTAFLVVNIHFLPPVLVWLAPTVVGSIAIVVAKINWRKKLGLI